MEHHGAANTELWVLIFNIVSFLVVVAVLGKFGWPSILAALKERENKIRQDLESMEKAKAETEALKKQIESQMASLDSKGQEMLAEAKRRAEEAASSVIRAAESQAKEIMNKSQRQLEEERSRVLGEVRGQIGALTVLATERIIKKTVDRSVHAKMVEDLLEEIERSKSAEA